MVEFWNDSSFVPMFDISYGNISYDEATDLINPAWSSLFPSKFKVRYTNQYLQLTVTDF